MRGIFNHRGTRFRDAEERSWGGRSCIFRTQSQPQPAFIASDLLYGRFDVIGSDKPLTTATCVIERGYGNLFVEALERLAYVRGEHALKGEGVQVAGLRKTFLILVQTVFWKQR